MPVLVEIGVLLDVVVGIFVMGIVMDHINHEFSRSTPRSSVAWGNDVLVALVMLPLLAGALTLAMPGNRARPWIVPAVALTHAVLTVAALRGAGTVAAGAWLGLDPLGPPVLAQVSALYLLCALYIPSYLVLRADRDNRVFTAAITALLGPCP